jgi:hypothetical protein
MLKAIKNWFHFGKCSGSKDIDAGLGYFDKAEARVKVGIAKNAAVIADNAKAVEALQAALVAFEAAKTEENILLSDKNARGERFIGRMKDFFGDDDAAAKAVIEGLISEGTNAAEEVNQ